MNTYLSSVLTMSFHRVFLSEFIVPLFIFKDIGIVTPV